MEYPMIGRRRRRWAWATVLAMLAAGVGSSAWSAEPTPSKGPKKGASVWKSSSKVDGQVKKVSASQSEQAVTQGLNESAAAAGQQVQAATQAAEQATAQAAEKAVTTNAEPPVKPTEVTPSEAPAGGAPTATEQVMDEVVEDVTPVSVQTGLCPPGRLWVRKEVLLWWMDGQDAPALVTTSPNGTPVSQAGVLGQPGTSVLYGGPLNDDLNVGGRFQMGYWLNKCNTVGLQGGFFFLGQNGSNFNASSDGSTILARPFFDADPQVNSQNSQLVSFPGTLAGSVGVNSDTSILGADLAMRKMLCCKSTCAPACTSSACGVPGVYCCRWDLLSGFRYFRLSDDLSINENLTSLGSGGVVSGTNILVNDRFRTKNNFYGYDIGTVGSCYRGRWFVEGLARIGIGAVDREARVTGNTVTAVPGGATSTQPGGLLTQPTNIGVYNDCVFSVMPELGVNVGYQVCKYARLFAGYTFLGVSGIARAGDQIDPVVNSTQIGGGTLVGPARPAFQWNDSFFWAQGINVGLDCRF